jgi:hypothetical protein
MREAPRDNAGSAQAAQAARPTGLLAFASAYRWPARRACGVRTIGLGSARILFSLY